MRLDVVVPTMDNPQQLSATVASIIANTDDSLALRFIVVNNHEKKMVHSEDEKRIVVVNAGTNLGWEGGLALGLLHSDATLVAFSNDDIYVPFSSKGAINAMSDELYSEPSIGAIGCSSNCVMGFQSIWSAPFEAAFDVPFLIGYFVMFRRKALDEVGGVDCSLPGGDDIDLSIRLRKAGYRLRCRKDLFLFHHGFQTGIRVHGDHTKPGGWNSPQMIETVWRALRAKHGDAEIEAIKVPIEEFWKREKAPA